MIFLLLRASVMGKMEFPSKAEPQKGARCDNLQMNDSKASELDKVDQGGKKKRVMNWKKVGPFL